MSKTTFGTFCIMALCCHGFKEIPDKSLALFTTFFKGILIGSDFGVTYLDCLQNLYICYTNQPEGLSLIFEAITFTKA